MINHCCVAAIVIGESTFIDQPLHEPIQSLGKSGQLPLIPSTIKPIQDRQEIGIARSPSTGQNLHHHLLKLFLAAGRRSIVAFPGDHRHHDVEHQVMRMRLLTSSLRMPANSLSRPAERISTAPTRRRWRQWSP
ncbi:unnamed protein product [Linum trigynum]|uniref:Uncharacterized protein n=1 Tax=Linum trigynum TaxID=586398 RepID=A0AAV2D4G6_9ROSI